MLNFLKITGITFTIWLLAALINAGLSGILLVFSNYHSLIFPGIFLFAFAFSLLFSLPGIFIFWLVFLICSRHDLLFRVLLKTGLITAGISALIFLLFLGHEFKGQSFFLALFAIISAVISVMVHHRIIVSVSKKINADAHV